MFNVLKILKKEFHVNSVLLLTYAALVSFEIVSSKGNSHQFLVQLVIMSIVMSFWTERHYKFDTFIDGLPVSRAEIVAGRYLYFFSILLMATIFVFFSSLLMGRDCQQEIFDVFPITVLFIAILLPCVYLFFPRIWLGFIIAIVIIFSMIFILALVDHVSFMELHPLIQIVASVVILYGSYLLSVSIYRRKDVS